MFPDHVGALGGIGAGVVLERPSVAGQVARDLQILVGRWWGVRGTEDLLADSSQPQHVVAEPAEGVPRVPQHVLHGLSGPCLAEAGQVHPDPRVEPTLAVELVDRLDRDAGAGGDAADTGDFDPKKDFYTWLNNTPGRNAWPIAGATFILLAKDRKDANIKTVKFFDWSFENGDATAKNLVYVPLPKSLKDKVRSYWKANGIY